MAKRPNGNCSVIHVVSVIREALCIFGLDAISGRLYAASEACIAANATKSCAKCCPPGQNSLFEALPFP
jgi:hypothetical protein